MAQFLVGFVERADHAFAQIPMNQSCRIHALPHYPDLFLSVLIRVNPWQKLLYPAHVGERLSRNAPRPSCPSGDTRSRAIRSAFAPSMASRSRCPDTSRTGHFACADDPGPAFSSKPPWRETNAAERRCGKE